MKVGENGYFGILVITRGQLPNFANRGTSLFTNRTTKRGMERALVNLSGCIMVKMHSLVYHLKTLGIDRASLELRGCQCFNVTPGAEPGKTSSHLYICGFYLVLKNVKR